MSKKFLAVTFATIVLAFTASDFAGCSKAGSGGASTSSSSSAPAEPDVSFKNLQGMDVQLASLKGKVVLVNFWATWCEPCRTEIPSMIEFQHRYSDKGFTMLGVAMDDDGSKVVNPFVQMTQFSVDGHPNKMDYPIVLGNDDVASKFGGLIGLPTSLMISRDGKIAKRYIGLINHDTVENDIKGLL
jgi:cytochrome c biogenesis protein CcmG/thiol:disulfide interchange protein DsbE